MFGAAPNFIEDTLRIYRPWQLKNSRNCVSPTQTRRVPAYVDSQARGSTIGDFFLTKRPSADDHWVRFYLKAIKEPYGKSLYAFCNFENAGRRAQVRDITDIKTLKSSLEDERCFPSTVQ